MQIDNGLVIKYYYLCYKTDSGIEGNLAWTTDMQEKKDILDLNEIKNFINKKFNSNYCFVTFIHELNKEEFLLALKSLNMI